MAAYALVNKTTRIIENIIEVDPRGINYCGPEDPSVCVYTPPDDYILIEAAGCAIGMKYINGQYIR